MSTTFIFLVSNRHICFKDPPPLSHWPYCYCNILCRFAYKFFPLYLPQYCLVSDSRSGNSTCSCAYEYICLYLQVIPVIHCQQFLVSLLAFILLENEHKTVRDIFFSLSNSSLILSFLTQFYSFDYAILLFFFAYYLNLLNSLFINFYKLVKPLLAFLFHKYKFSVSLGWRKSSSTLGIVYS